MSEVVDGLGVVAGVHGVVRERDRVGHLDWTGVYRYVDAQSVHEGAELGVEVGDAALPQP